MDILNATPTVENIRVSPTEPTISDTLTCTYDEPQDLDYDEIQGSRLGQSTGRKSTPGVRSTIAA